MVPVNPTDRWLLGMRWKDQVFVDKTLPFGLRSAPLIFSAVADALAWIMKQRGVSFTGTPSTTITFLGIEIDSIAMELRLPADKLARLIQLTTRWRGKKECGKRELLSLIGILNHACKVIKAGRSFLRRLVDLSKLVKHPDYFLRLNRWNGVSMMFTANRHLCEKSGKWGCGAFSEDKSFQLRWPAELQDCHITVKELVPIVLAAGIWGKQWSGKNIMAYCDNE